MLLIAILLLPLFGAAWLLFLPSPGRRFCPRLAQAVTGLGLAVLSLLTWKWSREGTLSLRAEWLPNLGLDFSLWLDGPALFYSWLILGIGFLVLQYSEHYMKPDDSPRRFYAALLAFLTSMLGIVLARNLILAFLFWEMTSLTSFLLIGHWSHKKAAVLGAQRALLITGAGGLCFLAGAALLQFMLMEIAPGTPLEWDSLREIAPAIVEHRFADAVLVLLLVAAFAKSAQFPFHFWLPGAMQAPTPVSALLHAATMVKAGIFLVGRMWPIFDSSTWWSPLLITCGLITFSYTAYQAFKETDLKAILARTTLSTLGLVMLIYGLKAHTQDALQIFNHAAYKGALFLVVGIVEHATHTRDIRKLGGLKKQLPMTFWCCVLAALSMAGLPPFFGFLAKESLYTSLLDNDLLVSMPLLQWLVIGLAVVSNAFIFAVSWKLIIGVFLGESRAQPQAPGKASHSEPDRVGPEQSSNHDDQHEDHHGESVGLWMPPAVLAVTTVIVGALGATYLIQDMVNAFSSDASALHSAHAHHEGKAAGPYAHVALIPTHIGPVVLSLLTIGLGVVFYRKRDAVNRFQEAFEKLPTMQSLWDAWMHGVSSFATAFSAWWQSGSLRWYFSGILVFFVLLSLGTLWSGEHDLSLADAVENTQFVGIPAYAYGLFALLAWSAITVARAKTRLGAAIAITATGFLVSLIFVLYRSPDIVLTQILIETVSTIFILLILFFMPSFSLKENLSNMRRVVNVVLACAVGFTAFAFTLLATTNFKEWNNLGIDYLKRSFSEGDGRNAVNVIIVDFRAIDTTGEIVVLVVVGLCIYGVLRSRRKPSGAAA